MKGLRHRRIRDVALVLIELAGCEEAARRNQRLVEFVHDRGFADAGISGDENELRRAGGDDPMEGRERARRPRASARKVSPGSAIGPTASCCAQRKWIDATARLPLAQATTQVSLDTRGGLVTLLCGLREKLHHDLTKAPREFRSPARQAAMACLAMWQCTHSIGSEAVNGRLPVSIS